MNKMSVRDVALAGRRVLLRADFNVPLAGGAVSNDQRIRAALPTLRYVLGQEPRALILMSHLGRPGGQYEARYSLAPVAERLGQLLEREVRFAGDCGGPLTRAALAELAPGGVLLLENTRFEPGETGNDATLARSLADLAEVFVNDAFGSAHRAHASTVGVALLLPAVTGLLMERELAYLATALEQPGRPFLAILGGAKVSDKIRVIESLLGKADRLLIGGGMANTFLRAQGLAMGDSLVEEDAVPVAAELLQRSGEQLVLPLDAVIGDEFSNEAKRRCIDVREGVPEGWAIYDIGPRTVAQFRRALEGAATILWNGPMGVFELPQFAEGSMALGAMMAEATRAGATTVIGGGDSAAAMENAGHADEVTHLSTGGGASLELLEGRVLPGVEALDERPV